MKAKILGIGVATLDIYVISKRMYPGGNEYNVAYNAKLLGAEAGFLGVFGSDFAGKILEDTLKGGNVRTDHCHHEVGTSGYSLVELKEDGDRVFLFWNQDGVTDLHPITFTEEEIDYIKGYDVTCIGRLADVSYERMQLLHSHGISLSYDFHATYTDEDIERVSPYIDYAFFSCSDMREEEIKRILKKAVDLGAKLAVGTCGADPVYAYDGEQYYIQETLRVEATDALGAGDSFIAGVLVNYLEEANVQAALYKATIHSAHVVRTEGSIGIGYDADPELIRKLCEVNGVSY